MSGWQLFGWAAREPASLHCTLHTYTFNCPRTARTELTRVCFFLEIDDLSVTRDYNHAPSSRPWARFPATNGAIQAIRRGKVLIPIHFYRDTEIEKAYRIDLNGSN
jgi:hypothetical protein